MFYFYRDYKIKSNARCMQSFGERFWRWKVCKCVICLFVCVNADGCVYMCDLILIVRWTTNASDYIMCVCVSVYNLSMQAKYSIWFVRV